MKKHGHYCKVCGEYKANEKFSGKGHDEYKIDLEMLSKDVN